MIVFHRSLNYINSIQKLFEDKCSAIDSIIELFNNCDEQSFVIKISSTYNSKNDLAVWVLSL